MLFESFCTEHAALIKMLARNLVIWLTHKFYWNLISVPLTIRPISYRHRQLSTRRVITDDDIPPWHVCTAGSVPEDTAVIILVVQYSVGYLGLERNTNQVHRRLTT